MAGPTRQRPGMLPPGTGHNRRSSVAPELTGPDLPPGWVAEDASNGEVAIATVAGGWPVFPCRPNKAPATRNGYKDATTDLDQVHAWWDRHPDHLVAVPTAELVVIDLDVDPDLDTWSWWQTLAEGHSWPIDENLVVATPSGGAHIYFAAPSDVRVRNSAGRLAPHVDVRATGGYVIAPGTTLSDGRRYEVLNLPERLPTAPGWLLDLLTDPPASRPAAGASHDAPAGVRGRDGKTYPATRQATRPASRTEGTRYGLAALDAETGRVATAPIGRRNVTLNDAAFRVGQLVAGGELDPVYAARQLAVAAQRAGLDQTEIGATIRSGMTAGAQHPRRSAA